MHLSYRSHFGCPRSKADGCTSRDEESYILCPRSQDTSWDPPDFDVEIASAILAAGVIRRRFSKAPPKEKDALYRLSAHNGRVIIEHSATPSEKERQRKFANSSYEAWSFILSRSYERVDGDGEGEIRLTVVDPMDRTITWDFHLSVQVRGADRLGSVLPWPNPHERSLTSHGP